MKLRGSLVAAIIAASLTAGCGAKGGANANAVAAPATEVARSGNAVITKDAGGTTTITSNGGTAQIRTGTPTGTMPGGLPPYPNAQAGEGMEYSGSGADGQQSRVVAFTTTDAPARVADFYTNAATQAGYRSTGRTEMEDTIIIALTKGDQSLTLTAAASDGQTQVQIASSTNR